MRGAIREDDFTPTTLLVNTISMVLAPSPNPQDDPFGNFNRPLSHFYDPVNNSNAILGGTRAPSWGLGVSDPFADPVQEDTQRRNHFSIYDAREAMYRALTGRAKSGQLVAATQADRKAYWATTFRALGNVVHVIQDMAQPQHTRNDPHSGIGDRFALESFTGHASVYEYYIEARAAGSQSFSIDVGLSSQDVQIGTSRPLTTTAYPSPRFNRYSDYFSAAQATGVASGVGMSDYSNRGFFSAGRNLNDAKYSLPSRSIADYQVVAVQPVAWNGAPINSVAPVFLYRGAVPDTVAPQLSASAVPLTSVSVWDEFLVARHARPSFSLNYMNYDAAADLLLPRAVAYSAGLIDYFFRGKLEISLPDEGVYGVIDQSAEGQPYTNGFRKIKLKLRNVTPPVVPTAGPQKGQSVAQDMSGTLQAVVKYHENTCYRADLSGEFGSREIRSAIGNAEFSDPAATPPGCRRTEEKITVSDPQATVALTAGASNPTTLTFNFATPIPVNATDVYLQVVFRGVQGTEQDAVVVGTKDISEPTHFTLINVTDYLVCYNDNWYYKNADGSLPANIPNQFSSALQAQSYSTTQFAFGGNAGAISGSTLSSPLVVVNDLAPGQFSRFAILTEPEVAFNDEISGYYSPEPPPYKLHHPAGNQLTVQGTDLPNDPYALREDWGPIDSFRNTRYFALSFGYRKAGTGDCFVRPFPASPAPPWKPLPKEPGYALVPTIKPVTINFN